jgi:hypothetical protein
MNDDRHLSKLVLLDFTNREVSDSQATSAPLWSQFLTIVTCVICKALYPSPVGKYLLVGEVREVANLPYYIYICSIVPTLLRKRR